MRGFTVVFVACIWPVVAFADITGTARVIDGRHNPTLQASAFGSAMIPMNTCSVSSATTFPGCCQERGSGQPRRNGWRGSGSRKGQGDSFGYLGIGLNRPRSGGAFLVAAPPSPQARRCV